MKKQILLIEDDDALRMSLTQTLELDGIKVIQANGLAQARRTIRRNFAGVILSDIRMPQYDGFDVLSHVNKIDKELPVIFLTGEADVPMALRAIKEGAYDFLEKPCMTDCLLTIIRRALVHRDLVTRTRIMAQSLHKSDAAAQNFFGASKAVIDLRANLRRVAPLPVHIHLCGANGVGKKRAAATLSALYTARKFNLNLNLDSIEKISFCDLNIPNEAANLFLENITFITLKQQGNLLSLLDKNPLLRVITSSSVSLHELKVNLLNKKAYNQLNLVEINIPTLAKRRDDLPLLFDKFLHKMAQRLNQKIPDISQDIYGEILARKWPKNLPELREFARKKLLDLTCENDLAESLSLAEQMDRFEKHVLYETLKRNTGKVSLTAAELGLPKKTLYDRLARHDLRAKDFKSKRRNSDN